MWLRHRNNFKRPHLLSEVCSVHVITPVPWCMKKGTFKPSPLLHLITYTSQSFPSLSVAENVDFCLFSTWSAFGPRDRKDPGDEASSPAHTHSLHPFALLTLGYHGFRRPFWVLVPATVHVSWPFLRPLNSLQASKFHAYQQWIIRTVAIPTASKGEDGAQYIISAFLVRVFSPPMNLIVLSVFKFFFNLSR